MISNLEQSLNHARVADMRSDEASNSHWKLFNRCMNEETMADIARGDMEEAGHLAA